MNAAARLLCAMTVLLVAGAARAEENADHAKANKAELEKLQGKWKVVSFLIRGQEVDELVKVGLIFKFKDDALAVTGDAEGFPEQKRLFRLDATTSPKLLDFAETAKAFDEHKEVVEAVYTLDGDTLIFCFNLDGEQPAKANRPATVESKADSSAALVKLERVKN